MKRFYIFICTIMAAMTLCAQEKDHNFEVGKNLDLFNQIYKRLDLMYVDTLNAGEVIGYGINSMLRSLDPYTVYYPEEKSAELKQMITGKYAGIGALVRYHRRLKRVVIDEPYANMPAAEAGLKKGDIILSIDDKDMRDKNASEVSSSLRGEPGTTFLLKVMRPTLNKELQFKITRKNIKMPELPYYGMVKDNIGYINLNSFPEDCAKDMRMAFIDLKKKGAAKLILDLRNNGGGSVAEAVDIINLWVPQGTMILEMKGKLPQAYRQFTTKVEPIDTVMPLVVIVNGETASASEITCGAIQDLDRGIIIGTRTYGKGLVQTPIELPYNTNLKLTTSKYYIPSGRCLQAINYKRSGGGGYKERVPDSLTHVFKTRAGREVRDGGGIKPDIEVKQDTLPNIVYYLDQGDSLEITFDWVTDYIAKHPKIAAPREFELSDAEYEDYKQKVVDGGFTYDPLSGEIIEKFESALKFEGYYEDAKEEFAALKQKLKHDVAQDLEYHKGKIKQMLEQSIIMAYYYNAGVIESTLKYDNEILEAVKLLNDENGYRELLLPRIDKKTENGNDD